MGYDAIVIGGGLGGLTAAATLAKAGKKTLLLEKHTVVGGCAVTFRRKDLLFEASLHEMDGMHAKDMKPAIFDELGVTEKIRVIRVPEFYRFVKGPVDFVMPDDIGEAKQRLSAMFPHETKGVAKFLDTIFNISSWLTTLPVRPLRFMLKLPFYFPFWYYHIFRFQKMSVGRFVDSIIKDETLKLILMANVGYYHDNPYELGMAYYGAAQGSYFAGGGHYIHGGSQQLSNALASVITENGGDVLTRHEALKIIVENGKAVGVTYRKASKAHPGSQPEQKVRADVVMVNAPLPDFIGNMQGGRCEEKFLARMRAMKLPSSAVSVSLGFKRPLRELGNRCYSTFVCPDGITKISQLSENTNSDDYTAKAFAFVDYGIIDSGLAPEGKSVGAIYVGDRIENWENLSKEEYKAKKQRVADTMIDRLEKLIPGVRDEIIHSEVATPLTIRRFTSNPGGVFYGYAQSIGQDMLNRPVKTPGVKNLYVTSAWGFPGGGFTGVILGGYWAARQALGK